MVSRKTVPAISFAEIEEQVLGDSNRENAEKLEAAKEHAKFVNIAEMVYEELGNREHSEEFFQRVWTVGAERGAVVSELQKACLLYTTPSPRD